MNYKTATVLSKILAGSIMISALFDWRLVLLPWHFVTRPPWTMSALLHLATYFVPYALRLVGSAAVLLGMRWGFYCVYMSVLLFFCNPFGTYSSSHLMMFVLKRLLTPMGLIPVTSQAIMIFVISVMNIVVTAFLLWTQVVIWPRSSQERQH